MRSIKPEPLTSEAFRQFGEIIGVDQAIPSIEINSGTCQKFAELAYPDCNAEGGRAAIHIFRAQPARQPIILRTFECHQLGSQTFIPLGENPFLVAVAPAGRFEPDAVRVFRVGGQQGIQFHRGTWHHFCLALDGESDFLVIDRVADEEDCSEEHLPEKDHFLVAF